MRLLIVEDEATLRRLVADRLRVRGFMVDQAGSLAEAHAALDAAVYDVAIVDRGLPDGEGLSLLRALSKRGLPALIATARGETSDRIEGLDAGADDYIIKPFDIDELAARLRALLRRPGARHPPLLSIGPLSFDPARQDADLDGVSLALGRREAALLQMLMADSPKTVVRDRVEDRLYAFGEEVTPNALEAVVSRLRRKLAGAPLRIESRRGIGWRLVHMSGRHS